MVADQSQPDATYKQWRGWVWLEVAVSLLAITAWLITPWMIRGVQYHSGFHYEDYLQQGLFHSLYPAVIVFVIWVVTQIFLWARLVWISRRWNWASKWLSGACIAVLISPASCFLTFPQGSASAFDSGFRDRCHKDADIAAIREWAATLDPAEYTAIAKSTWPDSVTSLNPTDAIIREPRTVQLFWGGGFHHWVLVVAPDETTTIQFDHGTTPPLEVEPGAWVWSF